MCFLQKSDGDQDSLVRNTLYYIEALSVETRKEVVSFFLDILMHLEKANKRTLKKKNFFFYSDFYLSWKRFWLSPIYNSSPAIQYTVASFWFHL